jgi:phosphate transport system substrate-binding protein
MKALFTKSLVAGAIALSTVTTALAADFTGAGASFPYQSMQNGLRLTKLKQKLV